MTREFIALIALIGLALTAPAPAEDDWKPVDPVPQRFPVVRDRLGYSWQLTSAGSFYSSGGNVFDSANQLTVHGERFVPERVESRQGHHAFTGRCGADWGVRREVWIDYDRAAACHLEEVRNDSAATRQVVVEIATHVRTPWRTWSALDGKARIANGLQLSPGAFLSFAPREGDSDLFLLLGDGAQIEAAEQNFTVRFVRELAPQASLRIFHAMSQRRSAPGMPPEEDPFHAWFTAGRLNIATVSGALANFAEPAAGEPQGALWTLRGGIRLLVTEPIPESLVLTGALGMIRLGGHEIASFDGRTWITRDGFRITAAPLPGQTVNLGKNGVPLEEVSGIRVPGEAVSPEGGLRLKNGDVWPGRPAAEPADPRNFVSWEVQGTVREVPRDWLKENEK